MAVIRPRRGTASLSSSLNADRKDREQIRRLLSRPGKPNAGPGGVLGVTRCIPSEFGSYYEPVEQWGTLYANGHAWTTATLSGTGPSVSTQGAGDTRNGLDSLVVAEAGWYSFRLQFYITVTPGANQPTAAYAAVVPPRGTDYGPVEVSFPVMLGAIPGAVPDAGGAKRSTGAVTTDAMRLEAGAAVGLHVSWDAGTTLSPNADGRPRCLVDVTHYA